MEFKCGACGEPIKRTKQTDGGFVLEGRQYAMRDLDGTVRLSRSLFHHGCITADLRPEMGEPRREEAKP